MRIIKPIQIILLSWYTTEINLRICPKVHLANFLFKVNMNCKSLDFFVPTQISCVYFAQQWLLFHNLDVNMQNVQSEDGDVMVLVQFTLVSTLRHLFEFWRILVLTTTNTNAWFTGYLSWESSKSLPQRLSFHVL